MSDTHTTCKAMIQLKQRDVRWVEFPVQFFLYPISYWSLAGSLGAGPGVLVGRELHGTETVSRCLYCTVYQSLTQWFLSPTDVAASPIQAILAIQR